MAASAELPDEDSAQPSRCAGWLVRDLVCHLITDAQDVLITLVTHADTEPTRNAATCWDVAQMLPTGDDRVCCIQRVRVILTGRFAVDAGSGLQQATVGRLISLP